MLTIAQYNERIEKLKKLISQKQKSIKNINKKIEEYEKKKMKLKTEGKKVIKLNVNYNYIYADDDVNFTISYNYDEIGAKELKNMNFDYAKIDFDFENSDPDHFMQGSNVIMKSKKQTIKLLVEEEGATLYRYL